MTNHFLSVIFYNMKKPEINFQDAVDKSLNRHRSVLDSTTKFQEASARVNRAIAKSVTMCGCLKVIAEKQKVPKEVKFHDMKKFMSSHLEGVLCPACREIIQTEIGTSLFYIAALCNILDIDLSEIMKKEADRVSTLGVYGLS